MYISKFSTKTLGQLFVRRGLTDDQISQLIYYANADEVVQKYSSDLKRFKNRTTYNEWFKRKPSIYSMVNDGEKLLGIVWFSQKRLPEVKLKPEFGQINIDQYKTTFALRVYPPARGKKLAKKLTRIVLGDYLASQSYQSVSPNGIWLTTFEKNIAAVKTYQAVGFKQISNANQNGRVVMILETAE